MQFKSLLKTTICFLTVLTITCLMYDVCMAAQPAATEQAASATERSIGSALQSGSLPPSASASQLPPGLRLVDWLIIVAYAAGTLLLGWYYSRRQDSTREYFVCTGSMNPLLIGVSLFATLLSTISYLSMPGESLGKGPVYMTTLLGLPLVYVFVGYVMLPVYMKHRVTSAYELLEVRLGLSIRMLGAAMFVILRLVWMSLLIYLTAKAMAIMLGVGEHQIPVIALITGLVAVTYTSMGGLRAVVITDFLQTILLYGGALLVLSIITWRLGGFGWFPAEWHANWDYQPVFSTDVSVRVTMIGGILNYTIWIIATSGGDQTSVQRFMATTDARAARRALATQLIVTTIVTLTLGLVGLALLGYFTQFPEQLPASINLDTNADKVFPHFISYHLPAGISGLVVAAMFAAAMSSVDSGVNSITAVVMTDFLDRFGIRPTSETAHVRIARWLAFGIGALVVGASSLMGNISGNITAVTNKTANLLTTPIFGLFFFALFVPFASPTGVWIGTICSTMTAALIAFSGPIFGFVAGTVDQDPISFQWIAPTAITVNLITGCLGSLVFPQRRLETSATVDTTSGRSS